MFEKLKTDEEMLVRLNNAESAAFRRLEEKAGTTDADALAIGRKVLLHGRALQRYVVFNVAASMPDMPITAPAVAALMATANDFVRLGLQIKAAKAAEKVRDA